MSDVAHPIPPPLVSVDEGQCAWCHYRISDSCFYGHNIADHCFCMGTVWLPCPHYLALGSDPQKPRENEQKKTSKLKCQCLRNSFYSKIYMKIYCWWKWRKYWRNLKQVGLLEEITIIEDDCFPPEEILIEEWGKILEMEG